MAHCQKIKNSNTKPSRTMALVCGLAILLAAPLTSLWAVVGDVGIRPFQPGVFIDWTQQAVEIEARVVLREGPLELLACSPQTREHESILVVSARPLHIFQAMSLAGLQQGAPARYDEKLDRWFPASGEPLDLQIRCRDEGKERIVPAAQWMLQRAGAKPPEKLTWVFSGSMAREEGGFAADADGTVACVVDFDSALIALSTPHSADNEELWLNANTKEVPPIGTRCTLVVRSAYHPKVEIEVDDGGVLRQDSKVLTPKQVAELLKKGHGDRLPFLSIRLKGKEQTSSADRAIREVRDELAQQGLDPDSSMTVGKAATAGE